MRRKGFTIIELIVVMAVISILMLLGVPKYKEYAKDAYYTKIMTNTKALENASLTYYMKTENWPRLTDTAYTKEQLETYAQEIYDKTGRIIELDEDGQYYDISYTKLKKYIAEPKGSEKYILQNPVGVVYYLDNLTEIGETVIAPKITPQAVITITNGPIYDSTVVSFSSDGSTGNGSISKTEWQVDNGEIVDNLLPKAYTVGEHTVKLRVIDSVGLISAWVSKTFTVEYKPEPVNFTTGQGVAWVVPASGRYKLEVWGAKGDGSYGGKGGYAAGEKYLEAGDKLYLYIGVGGGNAGNATAWNASKGTKGGGAADIRYNGVGVTNRIIVAGGGGGQSGSSKSGGIGGGLTGGSGSSYGGGGGTQSSGGARGYVNSSTAGYAGSLATGGTGGIGGYAGNYTDSGGGGGGGYYGGGGGCATGGGGGGSSYIGGVENGITTAGINSGPAKATITYMGSN